MNCLIQRCLSHGHHWSNLIMYVPRETCIWRHTAKLSWLPPKVWSPLLVQYRGSIVITIVGLAIWLATLDINRHTHFTEHPLLQVIILLQCSLSLLWCQKEVACMKELDVYLVLSWYSQMAWCTLQELETPHGQVDVLFQGKLLSYWSNWERSGGYLVLQTGESQDSSFTENKCMNMCLHMQVFLGTLSGGTSGGYIKLFCTAYKTCLLETRPTIHHRWLPLTWGSLSSTHTLASGFICLMKYTDDKPIIPPPTTTTSHPSCPTTVEEALLHLHWRLLGICCCPNTPLRLKVDRNLSFIVFIRVGSLCWVDALVQLRGTGVG